MRRCACCPEPAEIKVSSTIDGLQRSMCLECAQAPCEPKVIIRLLMRSLGTDERLVWRRLPKHVKTGVKVFDEPSRRRISVPLWLVLENRRQIALVPDAEFEDETELPRGMISKMRRMAHTPALEPRTAGGGLTGWLRVGMSIAPAILTMRWGS